MIGEGEDGVDHINIYSKGKTALGKFLSNFTYSPFEGIHGRFNSIEGYWYFLRTGDERFRDLFGYNAKKLGEELPSIPVYEEDEFRSLIKQAIDQKLKNNSTWLPHFAESILPFCHYYEYGGKRVDAKYEWIVEHFENRRQLMKTYYKKQNDTENR
jgi:hypothetical protein